MSPFLISITPLHSKCTSTMATGTISSPDSTLAKFAKATGSNTFSDGGNTAVSKHFRHSYVNSIVYLCMMVILLCLPEK